MINKKVMTSMLAWLLILLFANAGLAEEEIPGELSPEESVREESTEKEGTFLVEEAAVPEFVPDAAEEMDRIASDAWAMDEERLDAEGMAESAGEFREEESSPENVPMIEDPQEFRDEGGAEIESQIAGELLPKQMEEGNHISERKASTATICNNQGERVVIREEELSLLNCAVSGYGEYGEEPIRVYSGCPSLLIVGQTFCPVYGWSVPGEEEKTYTAMSVFLNGKLLWSGDQDAELPEIVLEEVGDCAIAFRIFDEVGRVAEIVDHVQVVPMDSYMIDFSQLEKEIAKDRLNSEKGMD